MSEKIVFEILKGCIRNNGETIEGSTRNKQQRATYPDEINVSRYATKVQPIIATLKLVVIKAR